MTRTFVIIYDNAILQLVWGNIFFILVQLLIRFFAPVSFHNINPFTGAAFFTLRAKNGKTIW